MEDIAITESQIAERTAAEYRSKGYEVAREVPLDFMPGFYADLLVSKNGETRVIEVQTRTSLAARPALQELAEILRAKPGWTFELRLVGEPERLDAPDGARPFAVSDVDRRIDEAAKTLAAGFDKPAFLMAWSACEAAIRIMVNAVGIEIKRVTWPSHVLRHAVMQGVISHQDDAFLSDMLAYRNAISHGFEVDDFDAGRVKELIVAAKQLRRAAVAVKPPRGSAELDARYDLLDPLEVSARLDELRDTREGWPDGDKIPDAAGLDWLSGGFVGHYPNDLPWPNTFPTPDGGIEADWSLGDASLLMEVDLNRHTGHALFFYDGADDQLELGLNLDNARDWTRLCQQIRQPLEAGV